MNTHCKTFKNSLITLSLALSFIASAAAQNSAPLPTKLPFNKKTKQDSRRQIDVTQH